MKRTAVFLKTWFQIEFRPEGSKKELDLEEEIQRHNDQWTFKKELTNTANQHNTNTDQENDLYSRYRMHCHVEAVHIHSQAAYLSVN